MNDLRDMHTMRDYLCVRQTRFIIFPLALTDRQTQTDEQIDNVFC